jgi:hypothetical protein
MTSKSSSELKLRKSTGLSTIVDDSTSPLYAVELYARDLEWETTLLTLLSELEQRIMVVTPRKFQSDPCCAVHQLGDLLLVLDEYTSTYAKGHLLIADRLTDARLLAKRFENSRKTLPTSLPTRNLLGFAIRRDAAMIRQRELCRTLIAEAPKSFESYLMALANGFSTGQGAAKWIETCSVFLRQVNKLVQLMLC